jgi:hypothetical protein
MIEINKKSRNGWEITLTELENGGKKYKVTRRMPDLTVAETKIFTSREEAIKQFESWSN